MVVVRTIPGLPVVGKTLATSATGVVVVADPGVSHDKFVNIRFTNVDTLADHVVKVYKRSAGGGAVTDSVTVAHLTVQKMSMYEHGPETMQPGEEIAFSVDADDKVNATPIGTDHDHT